MYSKEDLRIYESFDHCPDYRGSIDRLPWSHYPIKDGKVIAENTVSSLTAKYLGCRSRYWKNEKGEVLTGKPKTGQIGIEYTKYEYTKDIQIKMRKRNVSRIHPTFDGEPMYFLLNYDFIAVTITSSIKNIESLVLFDAQAERGCTNRKSRSALIKNYHFERNEKVKPINLLIEKLCFRDSSVTTKGAVVNSFPYELIFLIRAKTYDNKYYFTVKKILFARDSNRE